MVNFKNSGLCYIFGLLMLTILPLLFSVLAGIFSLTATDAASWVSVAVMMSIAMFSSLPVLYLFRPLYFMMGLVVFIESSVAMMCIAQFYAGAFPSEMFAAAAAPGLVLIFTLKYIRSHLHNMWDVCLTIRPKVLRSDINPTVAGAFLESAASFLHNT